LSLTLSPVFLLLKDLQRKRLAGRLTLLKPAHTFDNTRKNTERRAIATARAAAVRAARVVNSLVQNIFNGLLRVPVKKKNLALNLI
jgi:hypothetical protein